MNRHRHANLSASVGNSNLIKLHCAWLGKVTSINLIQLFWSAVAWHRFGRSQHHLVDRFTKAVPGHRTPKRVESDLNVEVVKLKILRQRRWRVHFAKSLSCSAT